jgi:hypothetical protein
MSYEKNICSGSRGRERLEWNSQKVGYDLFFSFGLGLTISLRGDPTQKKTAIKKKEIIPIEFMDRP